VHRIVKRATNSQSPIKEMSSRGLLDGATSELFKTYEADYQVTYNEAQQKLTQIRDLDGGELSPPISPWVTEILTDLKNHVVRL
jgi:hypothetical protein